MWQIGLGPLVAGGNRTNNHRDTVRVALTTGSRPACYFDTDMRIVETSDLLIFVWNGHTTEQLGGTGQIAMVARAQQKPSVFIDPNSLEVTAAAYEPHLWPPRDEKWDWMVANRVIAVGAGSRVSHKDEIEQSLAIKARLSELAGAEAFDFRKIALRLIMLGSFAGVVGLIAGTIAVNAPRSVVMTLYAIQLALSLWALRTRWQLRRHILVCQWTNARVGAEVWRGLAGSP